MSRYMYERLSAQDNSFLLAEETNVPLHVAAVGIYHIGDLGTANGGVQIRKFKRALEAQFHRIPRYRQRIQWVPFEERAVWVDDEHFNLDYHIRHTALPKPGGLDELKALAARITAIPLDRSRPLWEIWLIEGLAEDRFAMLSKIHHCMIDGSSGADVAQILMSPSPEHEVGDARPFVPRSSPDNLELLMDAVRLRARLPLGMIEGWARFQRTTEDIGAELGARFSALSDLVNWAVTPSSDTPINGSLSPHRHVDWLTLPLDDIKAVRRALNCTINDVVLSTVTGAIRQYLLRRGLDVNELDFRVSAPVNVRRTEEKGQLGNRVSTWIVRLPLDEAKPREWVRRISETTRDLKESRQALGFEMMMQAAEYLPASLVAMGARAAEGPINMIVTNVPGPQFPLYLLGAKLLELHPLVPLMNGTGLGIALFSYDGKLHVGLNADYDLVPDLSPVTALFAQAFMALLDDSGVEAQSRQKLGEKGPAAARPGADGHTKETPSPAPASISTSSAKSNGATVAG